jgi:hypothetical protein
MPDEERARFEEHLVGCPACQAGLEDTLQLQALGAELSRRPDRPLASRARARADARVRQWRWPTAAVLGLAAAAAALLVWTRSQPRPLDDRIAAALGPRRWLEDRVAFAPMDRYRELSVARGGATAEDAISLAVMGEMESAGERNGLAAALLMRHDFTSAEATLSLAGSDADLDVERAVLARALGRLPEAIALLDRTLATSPRHPQALWNRGLVLRDLGLPLSAAEAFEAVAALGEDGWGDEASRRARELHAAEETRETSWRAVREACGARMAAGTVPPADTVAIHPDVCRAGLYEAVRLADTRAAVEALVPVAQAIDRAIGDSAASGLVSRVASLRPPLQTPTALKSSGPTAPAAYRALTRDATLSAAQKERLLDRLRAAHEDDLLIGALQHPALIDHHLAEYLRLARATGDPFLGEAADEREARAKLVSGDQLAAEVILHRAVRACSPRDVELRCSYLRQALGRLYIEQHRPVEARAVALAGLQRSARLGIFWDESFLFDLLADAARFQRQHPLMRAYLREATLRARGDCAQTRYREELEAIADAEELRFADARRAIDRAPSCNEPPTLVRAVVLAELARFDGNPAETAALREGLDRLRQAGGLTPGQRAHADAIEGRLLAARDPASATPLLRRAIAAADHLGETDVSGAKARGYAHSTLIELAARTGDFAAALALLASDSHTAAGPRCVLGVLVDDERTIVAGRDRDGRLVHHVHTARTSPVLDGASLIPPDVVDSLRPCERVDVLAPPPVYGRTSILPDTIAWSYRRGPAQTRPRPTPAPTLLAVANPEPPPELGLPRLAFAAAPVAGASLVELRGPEATPERVARSMLTADAIEIHAHGFVDLGVSDASLIALSPQADGRFALGAREIAALGLGRAPFVILAACHAARTAPYLHDPWSLPYAFRIAGARAVLAPATPIPDAEAASFFHAVEERVLRGEDPAIVLRDERVRRSAAGASSWVRDVLLFD